MHSKKFDSKTSLFIKGFSKEWTHKDLYEFFKAFGEIISAKVSLNEDHLSRGYGFVQFSKEEFAKRAMDTVSIIKSSINFSGQTFLILIIFTTIINL